MSRHVNPAELAECIAPLDEEDRRALWRYWDQVIWEEWAAPVPRSPRTVSLAELEERRQRRETRRAIGRVAAAARTASVLAFPLPAGPAAMRAGGEAA